MPNNKSCNWHEKVTPKDKFRLEAFHMPISDLSLFLKIINFNCILEHIINCETDNYSIFSVTGSKSRNLHQKY